MKIVERLIVIFMLLFLPVLILSTGIAYGDDDYDDDDERYEHSEREGDFENRRTRIGDDDDDEVREYLDPRRQGRLRRISPAVMPARNQVYINNCSDCHLAYSPNMLPERSWRKLMAVTELEDHFGEYLELEEKDRKQILNYLIANSAERASSRLASKIIRSISSRETPIQISKIRTITKEHDDLPDKYITQNAKVLSLSQCNACHQQADKGVFDEDDVFIPYERLVKQ